jgi:sigma-B regulation protein RsbU (phosphoserine phosphatase)
MESFQCESMSIRLKPSDTLFLYTDGVTEAMNSRRELFSEAKLKATLEEIKDRGLKDVVTIMHQAILSHAQDEPQSDDITMLLLRYNGK